MFGDLLKGFFTFIFAFILGAGCAQDKPVTDSELQQKVQDHMDVIIDESAAIVDDVMDEISENEHVQEFREFKEDVNEIVDNTKADIEEHFGSEEDKEEDKEDAEEEDAAETAEAADAKAPGDEAEAAAEEAEAAAEEAEAAAGEAEAAAKEAEAAAEEAAAD